MKNAIISESKATVDEWRGARSTRKEKEESKDGQTDEEPYPFEKVSMDFESSIDTFQITVPFIMQTLPFMRRVHADMSIRKFVEERGEKLEEGEFELYRVSINHIDAVTRRLDEVGAIASGINRIPTLFIMGLISAYDTFLSNLIKCIFLVRPELLSSSERNISFKDLTEIGSVEAARERIIEKEVESVIRNSHGQQIDWLEKKLSVDLRKDLPIWPRFIELCERRNLLSHTDGVVSSQYLAVCKEHGADIAGLSVGSRLRVNQKYYAASVSIILEFGTKLTQVVWRKLVPDQVGRADHVLNELSFRLITKRRYREAITMLRFGLYEMKKHGEDAIKKAMVVNLANAEKLSGHKDKAEDILAKEDWSAATDLYQICVAAVRDDVETVVRLMRPVVDANLLQISHFQGWPVFEKIRSDPAFIDAFEREFSQKMLADHEAPTFPKLDAGTEEENDAVSQVRPEGNTIH